MRRERRGLREWEEVSRGDTSEVWEEREKVGGVGGKCRRREERGERREKRKINKNKI